MQLFRRGCSRVAVLMGSMQTALFAVGRDVLLFGAFLFLLLSATRSLPARS